ncbi:hypothetical protein Q7P37_008759 [Cladosporium fusiforme]
MSTQQPNNLAPYEGTIRLFLFLTFIVLILHSLHREDKTAGGPTATEKKKPPKRNRKPILKASDHHTDHKHHLLLAATGSVATIKIPLILHALSHHPALSIRLLLSQSAREFLQGQAPEQPSLAEIEKIPNLDGIYFDEDEWSKPWVRGDSILHIELRRWADLMVIAPLSCNALAKITQGFSDSLITSVLRAWDSTGLIDPSRPGIAFPYETRLSREELDALPDGFRGGRKKGILVAPAMNTAMWMHPVTETGLRVLEEEWGVEKGGLVRGSEACGEGSGVR